MKKFAQKGFTLIELLVVIAIIGILAGIILVSIDPSVQTSKANSATIKASMGGIPAQAAIIYTTNNAFSYDAVCDDPSINNIVDECNDNATAWAVATDIPSDTGTKVYCIDSTGTGILERATALGSDTAC